MTGLSRKYLHSPYSDALHLITWVWNKKGGCVLAIAGLISVCSIYSTIISVGIFLKLCDVEDDYMMLSSREIPQKYQI